MVESSLDEVAAALNRDDHSRRSGSSQMHRCVVHGLGQSPGVRRRCQQSEDGKGQHIDMIFSLRFPG